VIGKDITRFHAIYWPAFLLSAGLPVPEQVVVHGFLFSRGEKMSKSVGNVVSPSDLVRTSGVDQTRYFFLREVPFGQDGNYSHEAIVNRINADLANDLGNLAQRSLSMIAKNCGGVVPEHYRNEIVAFVKRGLNDLSISRTTFDWGVQVPDDPKHVMYVWVDALTNYLSATGFPDTHAPRAHFWPASAHVIGKDITRFHAIYWPAFLLSAGLPVPDQVVVHGFLFSRGEKMSKSVGNVVSPSDLVKAYGVDQTRYFFLREVPFGQDGNYSHEAIVNRINADLANDLGNLAQRSLSMIAKNCGGVVPKHGTFTEADREILAAADGIHAEARAAHETHSINKALDAIWRVVADANRYFAGQEPWALKKTDPARMETVLYVTAEVLRIIGIMVQPYMPASAASLLQLLSVDTNASFADLGKRLVSGTPLPAPAPIFPRYVDEEAAKV
jgi:methionyl-tRNA synthetase